MTTPQCPLEEIKRLCRDNKISNLEVSFGGRGDSGNQEKLLALNKSEQEVDVTNIISCIPSTVRVYDPVTNGTLSQVMGLYTLEDLITNHVNHALDESGIDWWNNDGGQGAWLYDVAADAVTFNIEQNEMVGTNVHNYEGPL